MMNKPMRIMICLCASRDDKITHASYLYMVQLCVQMKMIFFIVYEIWANN